MTTVAVPQVAESEQAESKDKESEVESDLLAEASPDSEKSADDTESKTPARSKKTRSTALEQKRQKHLLSAKSQSMTARLSSSGF